MMLSDAQVLARSCKDRRSVYIRRSFSPYEFSGLEEDFKHIKVVNCDSSFVVHELDVFAGALFYHIDGCGLYDIPKYILSRPDIKLLDISSNYFYDFPKDVYTLAGLRYLGLNCALSTPDGGNIIPEGISSLINLRYLDLQHNYIKTLPIELLSLVKLKRLMLSGTAVKWCDHVVVELIKRGVTVDITGSGEDKCSECDDSEQCPTKDGMGG